MIQLSTNHTKIRLILKVFFRVKHTSLVCPKSFVMLNKVLYLLVLAKIFKSKEFKVEYLGVY